MIMGNPAPKIWQKREITDDPGPQPALLGLRLKREEWRPAGARCMGGIHFVVASRGCKFYCYLAPSENGRIEMEFPPYNYQVQPQPQVQRVCGRKLPCTRIFKFGQDNSKFLQLT